MSASPNDDLLMQYAGVLGTLDASLIYVETRLRIAAQHRTTVEGMREAMNGIAKDIRTLREQQNRPAGGQK